MGQKTTKVHPTDPRVSTQLGAAPIMEFLWNKQEIMIMFPFPPMLFLFPNLTS